MKTEESHLVDRKTPSYEIRRDEKTKITIGEWLDSLPFGFFYFILTAGLCLGNVAEATIVLLASYISQSISCEWDVSTVQLALLNAAIFIGYLVGCSMWGYLSDRYGRRPVVLITLAMVGYYSFLGALVPTYGWAVAMRFVLGFSVAGITNAAVYFIEVIPNRFRAALFLLALNFWSIGTIIEAVLAMALLTKPNGWRILTLLTAILPILLTLTIFPFPESPRFLSVTGEPQLAMKAIMRISHLNRSPPPNPETINFTVEKPKTASCKRLFKKKLRKTTMLASSAGFCVGFLYFGSTIYTLTLIERSGMIHGADVDTCTDVCATLTERDYLHVIITSSAELPGALIAVTLSAFVSRKWVLIVSSLVSMAITLVLMAENHIQWVNLLFLFLSRGAAMVVYNTFNLYILEIFPTSVRSMGMATVFIFSRLGTVVTPIVAQVVMPIYPRLALFFYAFSSFVAAILVYMLKVDTSDEDLQDQAS